MLRNRIIFLSNIITFGHFVFLQNAVAEPGSWRTVWSAPMNTVVGLEASFTAVTSDLDRIYAVVVAPDRSVRAIALNPQGQILSEQQLLPAGSVRADSHNGFSIGIDAEGFLHVSGNMHNDHWNYWISTAPRSAAAFGNHSVTDTGSMWGDVKIGGWIVTYPHFFRDNRGGLWLTARTRALDQAVINAQNSLRGFRGGMLARYNLQTRRWDPLGERAPAPGNLWRLPMITWDPTGRAGSPADPDDFYQGYRIHLDFDAENQLHLSWIAWGTLQEGAPFASERSPADGAGATHLSYLRWDASSGSFLDADGAAIPMPASRLAATVLHANPGNLHFASFVSTGPEGLPVISFWRNGQHFVVERSPLNWETPRPLPSQLPDPARQLLTGPDGTWVMLDHHQVHVSTDRGQQWTSFPAPSIKQVDQARFRRTGQLLGTALIGQDFHIIEMTLQSVDGPDITPPPPLTLRSGEAFQLPAPGLLANAFHTAWQPLTLSLTTPAAHGTVALSQDGAFTYTPSPGFIGTDSFTFTVTDPQGRSDSATVTLAVEPATSLLFSETFAMLEGPAAAPWLRDRLVPEASRLQVAAGPLRLADPATDPVPGNHLRGPENGNLESAFRQLPPAAVFQLHTPQTLYLSFRTRLQAHTVGGEQQSVIWTDAFGDGVFGWRRFANNRISVQLGNTVINSTDPGQSGLSFPNLTATPVTLRVVLRLITTENGQAQLAARFLEGPGPYTEPLNQLGPQGWALITEQPMPNLTVQGLRLTLNNAGLAVDDLRMGSSFAAVTQPLPDPGIQVDALLPEAEEPQAVRFLVTRANAAEALSLNYSLTGTAQTAWNLPASGTMQLAAGQTAALLSFTAPPPSGPTPRLTLTLHLDPTPGLPPGNPTSASLHFPPGGLIDLPPLRVLQPPDTSQTLILRLQNPEPTPQQLILRVRRPPEDLWSRPAPPDPATWLHLPALTEPLEPGDLLSVPLQIHSHGMTVGGEFTAELHLAHPQEGLWYRVPITLSVEPLQGMDLWRWEAFGSSINRDAAADLFDANGSGRPNLAEFALGLSPLVAEPSPIVFDRDSSGAPRFRFPRAREGIDYVVEAAACLLSGEWLPVSTNPGLPGQTAEVVVSDAGEQLFLRLTLRRL